MNGNVIVNLPGNHHAQYLRVKQALESTGMDPSKFTVQDADLRLEHLLSPLRDTYTFNLYDVENAGRPLEQKLNRNDMFFVRAAAVCITKQNTETGPEQYANFPLFTYPDPNFFNGDDSTNPIEATALETVYQGTFSFLTKPVERIQSFLTHNFRYVPERFYTESQSTYATTGRPTNPVWPQYGPDDGRRGYYGFEPMPALYGSMQNQVQLVLGAGNRAVIDGAVDSAGDAANTRNVLVILLKGFKVLNGAELQNRWAAI